MEPIPPQDFTAAAAAFEAANSPQEKEGLKRGQSDSPEDGSVLLSRKLPIGTSRSDPFALLDKLTGFVKNHAPTQPRLPSAAAQLTPIMEEQPAAPPPANFLEKMEQYGLQIREEFEEIQDPLERALFLLGKMNVEQGSTNHAQLAFLIRAVCAFSVDEDDYTSILQWRHLNHSQNLLNTLCSGPEFESHVLGLKKWLLFQGLMLVRQLQVMQLSFDELHPRCVIARIIETLSFLSSLPENTDKIDPKPPIRLSALKNDLIRTVGLMFPESGISSLRGSVTEQFSAVKDLMPNAASLRPRILRPIETPPNICSVPLPLPSQEARATKLPGIRAQLAMHKPLVSRLILLARLAYYSPNLSKEWIPPDLIDTLYTSIGKTLFGGESAGPIDLPTYIAIGRKCVESNTQRSSVVYGALCFLKDTLAAYIFKTSRDLDQIVAPETKIFKAFRLFQSYSRLLTELSRLKAELIGTYTYPESLAQFNEIMKCLSLNLVLIIHAHLPRRTRTLLGEWAKKTGFDVASAVLKDLTPPNLGNIIKSLTGFHSYFLLIQLIALKYDPTKLNMETEIFNLLAEFPEHQRLFLLSPVSEGAGGLYTSPSAFWKVAKASPAHRIALTPIFVDIQRKAQEALVTLVNAHKPKVS